MLLLLAEVAFSALIAVGVALIYLPAGLVVAGVLGVLACEWDAARRRAEPATRGTGQ